jgi:hypothetical protein
MAQATDGLMTDTGFACFSRHRVMLGVSQAMLQASGAWHVHELAQPLYHSPQYIYDRSDGHGRLNVGSFAGQAFPPSSCNTECTSGLITAIESFKRSRRLQSFATEWCNLLTC